MWRWFRWVLLSLVVLIIIGAIVLYLMLPKKEEMANIAIPTFKDPKCTREFTPQFSSQKYYDGPLFDTHFHIPSTFRSKFNRSAAVLEKTVTLNQIVCELEKEKVVGAIAFYAPNPWLMVGTIFGTQSTDEIINQWIEQGNAIAQGMPEWIHLMYDPISDNENEAQKVYKTAENVFKGFGELVYLKGQSPRSGSKVDDEISLKTFKIANDNKLIIMVHPEQKDKAGLEKALSQNPDATFVLHGWDHDDYVMDLMNKYPNFYFTLDAAEFYMERGKYESSEAEFKAGFSKNYSTNLERAVKQWKPQIERHPDRYLWGTDRFKNFHYSEEMGRNFEEFARSFIGELSPDVQEYVAYRNAQRLFSDDKSDLPTTQQDQNKKSLGDLPEKTRLCVIEKIGEDKWREISTSSRPALAEEEKIIDDCSK